MAESYRLHLRFDPPAEPDALAAFLADFKAKDYDAPDSAIGPWGTFDSCNYLAERTNAGEVHVYYRAPLVSIADLSNLLTAHGIGGTGFLCDDRYGERSIRKDIGHDERFTFGTVPADVRAVVDAFAALNPERRELARLIVGRMSEVTK